MKNRTKLPNIYLGVVLALMYVPILVAVSYTHLDVYKRQTLYRLEPSGLAPMENLWRERP